MGSFGDRKPRRCPLGHRLAIPSHETRSQHFLCTTGLARPTSAVKAMSLGIALCYTTIVVIFCLLRRNLIL
jgi:hypothetical protein